LGAKAPASEGGRYNGAAARENIFSRLKDKIILQAEKTFAPDFRRDAQPLRLTRDKFPRTLREVFGWDSYRERIGSRKIIQLVLLKALWYL
jgi:hypothetical protein